MMIRSRESIAAGLRRRMPVLAAVLLVAFFVVAWILLGRGVSGADRAEHSSEPVPVTVMAVEAVELPFHSRHLGRTEAYQSVEIRSRVRGFLNERLYEEGGVVAAGDVLFRIDRQQFEAAVAVGEARVESAAARLVQASRQVTRYRALREQEAATESELDEWETAMQVAAADLQLARAQLVQAELDLGYTEVTSPIDGAVGRAMRDVGSYVDDGTNGLLAVVERVDPIYVRFAISESEMLRLRRMRESGRLVGPRAADMNVAITLRDGQSVPQLGLVTFVDVAVDEQTSTVTIRATVRNQDGSLRPGQFVHVDLVGLSRPDTVVVPKQAVVQTPTSATVYVVADEEGSGEGSDEGSPIEVRQVRLGEWSGDGWVIDEGLEPGEIVIVDNIARIRRDSRVRIDDRRTLDELIDRIQESVDESEGGR